MIQTTEVSITYKGDGVQTSFPYPYPYRNSDDIVGYIINDVGYEKRITNNFKYDKVSNIYQYPLAGDPLAAPYSIKLIRETPQQQNADLPGKLPFSLIEKSLDWIIMILQEIGSRCNSLWHIRNDCKLSETNARNSASAAAESEENAANSENLAKKWAMSPVSPDGVVDTNSPTGYTQSAKTWAALSKEYAGLSKFKLPIGYYNSVDEMKVSETALVGRPCVTLGYYEKDDGGGAVYIIRSKKESDVDDGGSIIFLDNGNVAELIIDKAVNVKQFGAKGNGETDDTTTLKATLQYAYTNALKVYLPKGTYCISEPLHLYQNQTLYGDLADNTTIKSTAPATENNAIIVLDRTDDYKFNYGEDYHINNITLVSVNNIPYGIYASKAAPYLDFAHLVISKVKTGISIPDTWLSSIKNTSISNIDIGIQLRSSGTSLHLENIYIMTPTKYGYDIHGLAYSEWSNVACDWATENAIAYNFSFGNVTINGLGCESDKCKICIAQNNSTLNITGATLYFPKTDTGDSVFRMNGSVLNITNADITLAGELSQNNTAVGFNLGTNNIINITRLDAPPALAERMSISDSANSSFVHISDYTSSHSMLGNAPHLGDTNSFLDFYKDIVPYNKKMNTIYGSLNTATLRRMDGVDISWNPAAKSGDILINCEPNTGIAFRQCMSDPTVYTLKGTVTAIDGSTITLSDWGFADDTMTAFARNMGTTINASGLFNGVAVVSISETEKTIVLKNASSASRFQLGAKVTYRNNITYLRDEKYNRVQHVLAGKSEGKPTTPVIGMMYFDTTLNKPVWYNGSNWVDANGNNV